MSNLRQHEERLSEKLVEKFFASIDERESKEKCWNWKGTKQHKRGYGRLTYGSSKGPNYYFDSAHRFSYRMHYGENIADNLCVCHKCDNPSCVNPFHLFLGTQKENQIDKISKGREARGEKHSVATKLKTPKGEKNPAAKLKESDVIKIRELGARGCEQREIAAQFGVSHTLIGYILRRKLWRDI